MLLTDPSRLWYISSKMHARGRRAMPRLIKAYIFVAFRAILPPEAILAGPVQLGHYALGVVIHPNVSIGINVKIWHNVTIAVSASPGAARRVVLGDEVEVGAGTVIISREDEDLQVVSGCRIGANSVVPRSLSQRGTYVTQPARAATPRVGVDQPVVSTPRPSAVG